MYQINGLITALMTWYLGTVPVVTYFSDSSLSEKPEGSGFSLRTNNTQHRYAKILVPVISKPSKSFFFVVHNVQLCRAGQIEYEISLSIKQRGKELDQERPRFFAVKSMVDEEF
jgi:hypothetical protein